VLAVHIACRRIRFLCLNSARKKKQGRPFGRPCVQLIRYAEVTIRELPQHSN
jgi:hypothetical protein